MQFWSIVDTPLISLLLWFALALLVKAVPSGSVRRHVAVASCWPWRLVRRFIGGNGAGPIRSPYAKQTASVEWRNAGGQGTRCRNEARAIPSFGCSSAYHADRSPH